MTSHHLPHESWGLSTWFDNFSFRKHVDDDQKSRRKVLDPQGPFLQKWKIFFVFSYLIAISVDPLFLYVPIVNDASKCLYLDKILGHTASILRSFTDLLYAIHIIFQFHTGYIAPYSHISGRGVLVEDKMEIAKRYLSSYFIIDVLAVLPLPQFVIFVLPSLHRALSLNTKNRLKFVVLLQYIPRVLRVFPLYKEVTGTFIPTETAWAGAAFNLFLFMLASHVFGASWYSLSIEREASCWVRACQNATMDCTHTLFSCENVSETFKQRLSLSCPVQTPNTTIFHFGIYLDALQSRVVETRDFRQKFSYCFWWGLRNLSSLGQNLETSTYIGEIWFAVSMAIAGLVLFSFFIGNMQTYMQSTTTRLEQMRVKRRDAERWMSHRRLPESLRDRIRRYEQYKWQETRGVDEENLIHNLPKDIRRDIKRHLCLALIKGVPMFEKMDYQLLDALCDRLKPVLYIENCYIVREGDPVDEMLLIMRGKLLSVTTDGGRTGFFNSDYLKAGDFCGEEHFVTWALDPHSSSTLPTSTRTVKALSDVEAFALMADDLKFVASQFRRPHSKQLRDTFRFYSQQWRTWAACFIQAAWRRYCRRKLEESLCEENRVQDELTSSPSLGATTNASRFAANAPRALRHNGARKTRIERLSPMLLQKPAEPEDK